MPGSYADPLGLGAPPRLQYRDPLGLGSAPDLSTLAMPAGYKDPLGLGRPDRISLPDMSGAPQLPMTSAAPESTQPITPTGGPLEPTMKQIQGATGDEAVRWLTDLLDQTAPQTEGKTVGGVLQNVGRDIASVPGAMVQMATHPVQAAVQTPGWMTEQASILSAALQEQGPGLLKALADYAINPRDPVTPFQNMKVGPATQQLVKNPMGPVFALAMMKGITGGAGTLAEKVAPVKAEQPVYPKAEPEVMQPLQDVVAQPVKGEAGRPVIAAPEPPQAAPAAPEAVKAVEVPPPVPAAVKPVEGAAKEPWQMKQVQVLSKKAESVFPLETKVVIKNDKPVYISTTTVQFGGKPRTFEIEGRSQNKALEKLHKKIIEQALVEGKYSEAVASGKMTQAEVDEILAEYPDHAKQAAPAPPAAAAPQEGAGIKPEAVQPVAAEKFTPMVSRDAVEKNTFKFEGRTSRIREEDPVQFNAEFSASLKAHGFTGDPKEAIPITLKDRASLFPRNATELSQADEIAVYKTYLDETALPRGMRETAYDELINKGVPLEFVKPDPATAKSYVAKPTTLSEKLAAAKPFISTDELRPSLQGAWLGNKDYVVATDGHRLIVLDAPHTPRVGSGIFEIGKDGKIGKKIDSPFPASYAVIPKEFQTFKEISGAEIDGMIHSLDATFKKYPFAKGTIGGGSQVNIGNTAYNLVYTRDTLISMRKLGVDRIVWMQDTPTSAGVLLGFDKSGKRVALVLQMPIRWDQSLANEKGIYHFAGLGEEQFKPLPEDSPYLQQVHRLIEDLKPQDVKMREAKGAKAEARKKEPPPGETQMHSGVDPFEAVKGLFPKLFPKEVPVEVDPTIQKVIGALKEAKSLRKEQERLYTEERGKRMARALSVGNKTRGEKGFYSELGQFKGEFNKVEFEAIRGKVGQEDIDMLFNRIKDSTVLNDWDKISARSGLAKIFGEYGGRVPNESELRLLNRTFGPEFIKSLLDKRDFWKKFKEAGYQIANFPRTIMASYDLSAPLRQGVFFATRPKQFFPAFREMFKAVGSETGFKAVQDEIVRRPTHKLMTESKLALTEMDYFLVNREEKFMSQWADKVPGVQASGRAYTGFLNKLRADVFDDLINKAEALGLDPKKNVDLAREIANFVNVGTGRGSLGSLQGAATALNSFFFSPRLMSARLTVLNPAYYIKASPFVRKQALYSLFTTAAAGLTIVELARLGGANAESDPRSSDFGKIIIGNTRIDPWGGFQQYVRMAGQVISGQYISSTTGKLTTLGEGYRPLSRLDIIQRQVESKEAPVFSFVTTLLKGQGFTGQPLNIKNEIGNRLIPMAMSDMYELIQENPKLFPIGVLGFFGMGSQTYGVKGEVLTAEQKKNIFEMSKIIGKQEKNREGIQMQAEALDEEFLKLPAAESLSRYRDLKKTNHPLAKKLAEVAADRMAGLTYEERLYKQLGVENGQRAKYILTMIENLKTASEKQAKYNELKHKKIISPEVAAQMARLQKQGANR